MPAIDWNYLSFLSALVLFIIYFKNHNNYEWFFTCDYLFSLTLVIVTLVNRYSKTTNFYITILSLLILTAALIIQIRGQHLYCKYNNLIDYKKRIPPLSEIPKFKYLLLCFTNASKDFHFFFNTLLNSCSTWC